MTNVSGTGTAWQQSKVKASSIGANLPTFQPSVSVLNGGNWYRIGIVNTGIYQLNYSFLKTIGIDVNNTDPNLIQVYGNGGGQLPYANATPRLKDLVQNPVLLKKDTLDGKFNPNDYLLFYASDQTTWTYSSANCPNYHHQMNLYSDTTYYFITVGTSPSKKISTAAVPSAAPSITVTGFDDYAHSETNSTNNVSLIQSGKQWYGFHFNVQTSFDYNLNIPNIDASVPATVHVDFFGRYNAASTYQVTAGGATASINPSAVNTGLYFGDYGSPASTCFSVPNPPGNLDVNITQLTAGADGWLNYIEVNFRRKLTMVGNQMSFRDASSVGAGNVSQFVLNSSNPLSIWDVSAPTNAVAMSTSFTNNAVSFVAKTDSLHEYIAFVGSNFQQPIYVGRVGNQNLHGLSQADLLIITHPLFIQQANELAEFHEQNDHLNTVVVTTPQIYNEFSSGSQDVSAIRDFIKMFYDRSTSYTDLPKYVLLFGTGSYDNLYRTPGNTNFIPTYQSDNSYSPTDSYVSDDFYGLLDYNEGQWTDTSTSLIDIGIGRLTVSNIGDAQAVVNKILHYNAKGPAGAPIVPNACLSTPTTTPFGDWRNTICFVADAYVPDCDIHAQQADAEATNENNLYPVNNVDKIFLDAYPVVGTPGGDTYPAAEAAINSRVSNGALIINYTGHGGQVGWSHDRVLGINDIQSWTNINAMPLFVTATCEFSTYDNPAYVSAGEDILLNPNGGGIALFSTVRLVFSSPNYTMNNIFYDSLYSRLPTGDLPRLGDQIRMTKVGSGPGVNGRNFTLLGDPAVRLAFPFYNVITDSINGDKLTGNLVKDTVKAMSKMTVSGHLVDQQGNILSGYNGYLFPTVYDKFSTITTLANGGGCVTPMNFQLQKNILYKGLVSVKNGKYNFSFIVPRDINYQYGQGKISYYAENMNFDGNGYTNQFIIGGSAKNAVTDNQGPGIKLYMNDPNFVPGGETTQNPYLYALLKDSSGINTVGNGIGHDLMAYVDGNTQNAIVLNGFYQADLNSFKSGTVRYPFSNLPPGKHTVTLKAWDVYNNSSSASLDFMVANNSGLTLAHVYNYPNPFTTHTSFIFEYNRCCEQIDVEIQILTVTGKVVKTIHNQVITDSFRAPGIDWDGKDEFGHNIGRGVYVYHLKIRSSDGATADKFEKLVVLY